MMVGPVLPLYVAQVLGRTERLASAIGMISAAVGIPCVLFSAAWGRWTDRVGPATTFLLALLGMGLVMPFFLACTGFWSLFWCRFVLGIFYAGAGPAAHTLAANVLPEHQKASGLSLLATAQLLGNTIGPLTGGFVSAQWGFTPVFLASSTALLAASVWLRYRRIQCR
jgi:MFS transporter, DHA1 family, multidrug resistance protein